MLKLESVAAFVAVAESGSISEAAHRMELSKSVVSERLAELECSLGAQAPWVRTINIVRTPMAH